ncbi:hypothetical protein HANVADRAFT_62036 [Hanseniaspora valbyensis NRRL Y-1626]|uniref:CBM21 domain-containing protein n=1 Tax=Hanseniaspora valbyensis NRRL Y-1626 TaxID=766949 RepID=A0A1B7TEX4_9ASCO|nr:hypothetical protein HANVADRAFT_62036 [Hanseniaspora valbyensis NRRL Y-1626]
MSLTNLSSTSYYFEKMKEPKPRSTSLDDLQHFGLPTSPNIKKDQTFTILESNFDYNKNIISQYPWQYKSKTIEMKSISLEPTLNEVIIFLSVQNLAFEKLLEVKYSFDNWNSISFTEGIFCNQINNNFDEFKCIIKMPSSNEKIFKTNLDFCCKYEVKGLTYYDNNDYNNFRIKIQTTQKSAKFDASVKLPEKIKELTLSLNHMKNEVKFLKNENDTLKNELEKEKHLIRMVMLKIAQKLK